MNLILGFHGFNEDTRQSPRSSSGKKYKRKSPYLGIRLALPGLYFDIRASRNKYVFPPRKLGKSPFSNNDFKRKKKNPTMVSKTWRF